MTEPDDASRLWGRSDQTGGLAVWAPSATTVTLLRSNGPELTMAGDRHGWHRAPQSDLAPGDRYGIRIGDLTLPDPASRSQPNGPGALSEAVDPGAFPWTDAAWQGRLWHETVLYELHLGTFTDAGSFAAAVAHLDHLSRLGVTTIELMPVSEFPGARNWGYDGVLPFAPYHGYGRPDDFKRLVDAAHAFGIAVVLDVVYNHFGPAQNSIADVAPEFFTGKHKTPWGGAIDFSQPAVRAYFVQNAVYWIEEFHLDGLRLDAVQAVFDDGPRHILDEIADRVRAVAAGRHVHLMLENDDNEARWLARAPDGSAEHYDAQWNDDFHHVMRVLLAGRVDGYYRDYAREPLAMLGRALTEGFSYQGTQESIHRPGLMRGTASAHLPPVAFVNFLQNHDQVGNTPFGKRLSTLSTPATLRLGVAVMLLGPAVPMLFMGEEWAAAQPFHFFCDYDDDLANIVRRGRHDEFKHLPEFSDPAQLAKLADPNAATTRDACVLDWTAPGREPHAEWLAFYTALLSIRRDRIVTLLPLIAGGAGRYDTTDDRLLTASWALDDGRTLTMTANFSDTPATFIPPPGETLFRLGSADAGLSPWGLHLGLNSP